MYVCLCYVSIRASAKSPNKRAEKSNIFPGISLPRELSLVFPQKGPAAVEAIQICDFFFFPLSSLAVSPLRETVPAQCFLMIPLRRHYKRLTGSKSFPSCSKTFCGPAALASDCAWVGWWLDLTPPPPSPGALRSRVLGGCARAGARGWWGNLWKLLSVAGRVFWSPAKPSKTLALPKR